MPKMILLIRFRAKKELIRRYKTDKVQTFEHHWWAPKLSKNGEHIIKTKLPENTEWEQTKLNYVLSVRNGKVKSYTFPGWKDFIGEQFFVDYKLYMKYC